MYRVIIQNGGSSEVLHELSPKSSRRLGSGKFSEEVNKIPSFVFSVFPSNPCFDRLSDRRTAVSVLNTLTNETEFEGTVLMTTKSMSTSGKVVRTAVCEGFLGFLCDSVQMYRHFSDTDAAGFLSALLDVHNAQMLQAGSPDKQIFLGMCDVVGDNTNSKTTAYRNTLDEIRTNLIDRIGGEIRVRRVDGVLVLDYLTQISRRSSSRIALADNMQSLEVKTDSTNIISMLIPLGAQTDSDSAKRLDISSVNGGSPYIVDESALQKYGPIAGTVVFDDITLPENLIRAGREYLGNNNRVKSAYRAQALDLSMLYKSRESIRCGNIHPFYNPLLGVDEELRIMKRTVDIYKPYKPVLEIGDKADCLTDIAVRNARLIEYELPRQKNEILSAARDIATALINAGINGYVSVSGNEILIMDTPDKETASRVWRWNSGGFGYSSSGYNGPYSTAVTMDGAIVADFITAGVLRGLEINNGDGTFHVAPDGTVTAAAVNITGGSVNITTNDENYDVIALNCGNWFHQLSPLQWVLQNKGTGSTILAQAGGIFFYKDDKLKLTISAEGSLFFYKNDELKLTINAEGTIRTSDYIICEDLMFKDSDSVYNSLRGTIDTLNYRVSKLESAKEA